jgi:asparagine synthase (glutamine-hydrolysing)
VDYADNDRYFVAGKFQPEADAAYIKIMQEAFDTEHHNTVLTPEMLIAALQSSTSARDLPGMADVDFSLFVFCGKIRERVKVALSGECADEIFGGYPWFRDPSVRAADGFPWAQNVELRSSLLTRFRECGANFVKECYADTLRNADILPGTDSEDIRVKEMVNLNIYWFMQTLLDRKDRMSMYHGLEVRVPFCDHRIAEYMYIVPWRYKEYEGREKGLLRKAMEGIVPERVLWRKKSPYPKTHDPKYTELVEKGIKELLTDKSAPVFEILRYDGVRTLLETESKWPWYGQLMRRPQTLAYILQINEWLKMYQIDIL